jgi:hypothetical protein
MALRSSCWSMEHEVVKALKPSLTTRKFFQDGVVRLALNVAVGTGLTPGRTMADELATLFREVEFDDVRTFTPSPPLIGDYDDEGNWLALRVLVPYRFQFDAMTG